ncbi:MAG: hypothetical protein U0Q22_03625 [Acidimicrobiales bacterium]
MAGFWEISGYSVLLGGAVGISGTLLAVGVDVIREARGFRREMRRDFDASEIGLARDLVSALGQLGTLMATLHEQLAHELRSIDSTAVASLGTGSDDLRAASAAVSEQLFAVRSLATLVLDRSIGDAAFEAWTAFADSRIFASGVVMVDDLPALDHEAEEMFETLYKAMNLAGASYRDRRSAQERAVRRTLRGRIRSIGQHQAS